MRHLFLAGLALYLVTQCGCLSLAAVETGRTVGQDGAEVTVSATTGRLSNILLRDSSGDEPRTDDDSDLEDYDYIPVVELSIVVGAGERTNVGLRASSTSYISPRVKQQLIGTDTSLFAASVGLEGGINLGAMLVGDVAYMYGTAPLYLSLHSSETVVFYAVPRYLVVRVAQVLPPPPSGARTETSSFGFSGLSYGVAIGAERRVAVELAHVGEASVLPTQLSVGLNLRID